MAAEQDFTKRKLWGYVAATSLLPSSSITRSSH